MDIRHPTELARRNRIIYERIIAGESQRALAVEFGMSHQNINRIYKTYKKRSLRKANDLETYIEDRLDILSQLCVKVTASDKEYMRSLTNKTDVENFAYRLIANSD